MGTPSCYKLPTLKPHLYWGEGRWLLVSWGWISEWDMDAINAWVWMIANPSDPDRAKAAAYLQARRHELKTSPGPVRTMGVHHVH